jgi:hypothetical protein
MASAEAIERDESARIACVIRRYARLLPNGNPTRCWPSKAERCGAAPRLMKSGTDDKVIYDTLDAATWAGMELGAICDTRFRPYPCARSRRGHYHLRTA